MKYPHPSINPFNKGAYVNKLDFVILASLEVDVDFNCNVVVGSDGVITGAQGGHPDTAAGAKCIDCDCSALQENSRHLYECYDSDDTGRDCGCRNH